MYLCFRSSLAYRLGANLFYHIGSLALRLYRGQVSNDVDSNSRSQGLSSLTQIIHDGLMAVLRVAVS